MFNELALKIEEHLGRGSNFAIAQVIDRLAPSSGKVGDKALILESGELIGYLNEMMIDYGPYSRHSYMQRMMAQQSAGSEEDVSAVL